MSKEGALHLQPSGQWAIKAPGREPVPIVAGEIFLLEVQGERRMMRVRMERKEGAWYAVMNWHLLRRVELRDGLRAGFFDQWSGVNAHIAKDQLLRTLAALVWTAPAVQGEFDVGRECRVRSCNRPIGATVVAAGHDVIR